MPICEKCWGDAYLRSRSTGHSQIDDYTKILQERKHHPCTQEEQDGEYFAQREAERREKAIQEIWGFMRAYDDPSVVFGSSIVVLCAIRDVIVRLNLPSSKDIGNRAVLESLPEDLQTGG